MKKWEKPQIILITEEHCLNDNSDVIHMSVTDPQDQFDNEGKDQTWD